MSDIDYFAQESSAYTYPGAENFVGRIVKIDSNTATIKGSDNWFDNTTLADGTAAYHYMFIK